MSLPPIRNGSIWITFVLASLELLKYGGRLAMIVPAEIFSVSCVGVLRNHLLRTCRRILLIEPETLWFPETSQGTVMLLAERNRHDDHAGGSCSDGSLSIMSVRNREFLSCDPDSLFEAGSQTRPFSKGPDTRLSSDYVVRSCGTMAEGSLKWSWYFLDAETRALIDRIVTGNEVRTLGELAEVELGVVTGANDFFIVPDSVIEEYGLHDWTHPCISKARHVPGCIHDACHHERFRKDGEPVNLLDFRTGIRAGNNGSSNGLPDNLRRYILSGERRGFHKRYKCRIRSPWFHLPPFRRPSLVMLIQAHEVNRMCLNKNSATIANSLFSIEPGDSVSPAALALLYHNPLTALHAEILGRSYGGGVLQLMPTEARNLPVPVPASMMPLPDANIMRSLHRLDQTMRHEQAGSISINDVIRKQGDMIGQALGLTASQRGMILSAWNLMRNRRHRKG